MISRTWTVDITDESDLKCYKGFDKNFAVAPNYVAVVSVDGEIENWALDDTENAWIEFNRYLTESEFHQNIIYCYVYQLYDCRENLIKS